MVALFDRTVGWLRYFVGVILLYWKRFCLAYLCSCVILCSNAFENWRQVQLLLFAQNTNIDLHIHAQFLNYFALFRISIFKYLYIKTNVSVRPFPSKCMKPKTQNLQGEGSKTKSILSLKKKFQWTLNDVYCILIAFLFQMFDNLTIHKTSEKWII